MFKLKIVLSDTAFTMYIPIQLTKKFFGIMSRGGGIFVKMD